MRPSAGRNARHRLRTRTKKAHGGRPDITTTYTYQPATGRFASVTAELRTQTFSYGYLPNSDLLETTTLPNNVVLTKAYEPNRNLVDYLQNTSGENVVSKYEWTVRYAHSPQSRRRLAPAGGARLTQSSFYAWGHNPRNELTDASRGRLRPRRADPERSAASIASVNRYLGTDPADTSQPITAEVSDPGQSGYFEFQYDPIGNRTGSNVGGEPSSATYYTTNGLNQYTSVSSGSSVVNPTHDDDGNMTFLPSTSGGGAGGEGWTLQWNAAQDEVQLAARTGSNERSEWQNRMTAAEEISSPPGRGRVRVEYQYDYMGRRISKKVYSWQTDTWQLDTSLVFVYDSWNLIAELDALNNNAPIRTYTWGLDLSQSLQGAGGIGGLLAIHDADSAAEQSETGQPTGGSEASKSYAVTYDANGNVGQLIDLADGSTAAHYEYAPFGQPPLAWRSGGLFLRRRPEDASAPQGATEGSVNSTLTATGPAANLNPFQFSTKYHDTETGLVYYGFRYYSPRLGRWVSRDPVGEAGGANLHAFLSNSVTGSVDAIGLWPLQGLCDWLIVPNTKCCCAQSLTWKWAKEKAPWVALEDRGGGVTKAVTREFLVTMRTSELDATVRVTNPNCAWEWWEKWIDASDATHPHMGTTFKSSSGVIKPGDSYPKPDFPSVKTPPLPARMHLQILIVLYSSKDPSCKCEKQDVRLGLEVKWEYDGEQLTSPPPPVKEIPPPWPPESEGL